VPTPTLRCCSGLLLLIAGLSGGEDAVPAPFPDMAPTVGAVLEHDYYDHSRFKPRIMVERALRALEGADISIDTQWQGGVIVLEVGDLKQSIPAPEPAGLRDAMLLLEGVRGALDQATRFTAKQRRDFTYAMLNGALLSLDPHTLILPPEQAKDFAEEIDAKFFGIGAFLNQEEGVISIERVMPGLPAERAGVEDGDIIVAVDGEKIVGLSLDQAVRRIKGERGSTVTLTVERKSEPAPKDIAIVRDLVEVITMRSHRDGNVGYLRMDEFNANTARDLWRALAELAEAGPLEGFVLDLRFNGGGLLEQSRIISDFFLTKNLEIVRTVTVGGEPQIFKSDNRVLLDCPMVLLTGGSSASAAEILSGALQCNDRAVIAGTTTFGKGSVQSIRQLRDGSRLKLTIQEYQLSGGISIQDVGVSPDLRLVRHVLKKDGSVDLLPYTSSREADDEFALAGHGNYQHATSYQLGWLAPQLEKEEAKRSAVSSRDFRPDPEASLVVDLLKQAVSSPGATDRIVAARAAGKMRQVVLDLLQRPVELRAQAEAAALSAALGKRVPAVAWGADAVSEPKSLAIEFRGPATVTAGSDTALAFSVSNRSDQPAGRLFGVVRGDRFSPLWEDEVVFGEVPGKGSASGAIIFDVPPRLHAGEERFTLDLFRDGSREVLASVPVQLTVKEQPRPHFDYRWDIVEAAGAAADGVIRPGEEVTLKLVLRNSGTGDSAAINLLVFKDNDPWVQLGGGRFKLPPLAAGAETAVEVPVKVMAQLKKQGRPVPFAGSAVKLRLAVDERFADEVDGRYRANLMHAISLPVGTPVVGKRIQQPRLEVQSIEHSQAERATITVRIVDDNLRFVALFQDEGKVDMKPADQLVDGLYRATVALKPGANAVRVVATDGDEVSEILSLRLWGPEPVPALVAPEVAKPVSKPAVDPGTTKPVPGAPAPSPVIP